MSQATLSGHLETYADSNSVSPLLPYRSALFVPVVSAGGAFGLASAAEVQVLLNTLNAVIAALNSREITALP